MTDGEERETEAKPNEIKSIPAIEFYERMYGRSVEGNDQKAIGIFKSYESRERHRRFQHELQMVKEGRVSEKVLEQILKAKRKMKHQGWENWAAKMLIWFAEKKI